MVGGVVWHCGILFDDGMMVWCCCRTTWCQARTLLVEFAVTSVPVSVSICSTKDNYSTIIPSIHVLMGDAVDCSIIWWCHVGMDDFVHGWQCNNSLWWCNYQYRCPMGTIPTSIPLSCSSSSLPHYHNSPCRCLSLLSSASFLVLIIIIMTSWQQKSLSLSVLVLVDIVRRRLASSLSSRQQ